MDDFFIEFHDPLFSIIVFFLLIFVVTFFSYWWGRYRYQKSSQDLDNFLKGLNSHESEDELPILIQNGELSQKSWLLLAESYFKSGDYEKSIDIYNELLKLSDVSSSKEIMFLLGKTYFKAGFLERSKQMFLEILKNYPKTPEALKFLLLVYENLRDYRSALETLEPLEELQKDIAKDSVYLKLLAIINTREKRKDLQIASLLEIYKQNNYLTHMVFEFLFQTDIEIAWKNIDILKSELLIDIFWHIDEKNLDFDIISKSDFLKELYTARGDIDAVSKSSIFEFDVLINLKKSSNATLNFDYVCSSCQYNHPFAFNRCSRCHNIDTQIVEFSLAKNYFRNFNEENNSFQ
ncbi:MAG: tetratricopeptide repeat protein [Campylobacterota bacterium]|nr:tetratricopeptide repeat protein [Campylobacterota bacterium]